MSALMLAAFRGYAESVTALLTSVRNEKQLVLMKNQSDFNALMLAAIYNQTDSIQAILDNVKNPEELVYFPNNDGKTALMICSRNESDFEFNPNGLIMMLETVKKFAILIL
jgi:ankyrin repeat protein